MKVDRFDFDLPDSSIALRPVSPRDQARLLLVPQSGHVEDHHVYDLPDLLEPGDVLVLNRTRVLPAALAGIRPARAHGGGGDVSIDINLHKQVDDNTWRAFVRPAKRLKVGDTIHVSEDLVATVSTAPQSGECQLRFNVSGDQLSREIDRMGMPPLPPYIARQRPTDARDVEDYQTFYARDTGSVAAPTAGLHFTPELFDRLTKVGVEFACITLHVGAGTFLPVKSEDSNDHIMHSEWFTIDADTARQLSDAKSDGRRIIAVGTTSLRALESAATDNQVKAYSGETDIFITPGYEFEFIDGLMTNFHLPRSTLFMLVCAICGTDRMKAAYLHAITHNYRFYSYGDSSLLWKR